MPYVIVPKLYFSHDGAASWVTPWIDRGSFNLLSWNIAWTADAANNFALSLEGTNDPTVINDTTFAPAAPTGVTPLTISVSHGTWPTVGAAAGQAIVNAAAGSAFERLKGTRTGGNSSLIFTVWISGREH